MVLPLIVLAVCSLTVGILCLTSFTNWGENRFVDFLGGTPSLAAGAIAATQTAPAFHLDVAGLGTLAAVAGIVLAMFSGRRVFNAPSFLGHAGRLPSINLRPKSGDNPFAVG